MGAVGAVLVTTAAITPYATIKAGQDKAEAQEQEAYLKMLQADELEAREAINEQAILENSERIQLEYGAAVASTGFAGGGIGGILRIKRDTEQAISNARRDASFKAMMLRRGADIELNLASDTMAASYITGAGTLLSFAGNAYASKDLHRGPSKNDKLDSGGG